MKLPKTYVIQVEGDMTEEALQQLRKGVELKDGMTRPAKARKISDPGFAERNPPVRKRQSIPTSWVELVISEGRNRQVRRMSAAVGFPTLRLVRTRIGNWTLEGISEGESTEIEVNLPVAPKNNPSRTKAISTAPGSRSKRPTGKSHPNSNKDEKSNRGGKTSNRPHPKGHSRTGQKSPAGKAKR